MIPKKASSLKIPIYSQLKLKLESKGLDSTTSGQIAWFVCSLLWLLCLPFVYQDQYTFLFIMFFIFTLNLIYFKNIFPLFAVVVYYCLMLNFSQIVWIIIIVYPLIIVAIAILSKHFRFLITFFIGIAFFSISLRIFDLLGGFYK